MIGPFARFLTGWRHSLQTIITNWQSRRPLLENGFRFLWAHALHVDAVKELLLQGINAWGPGSPGATTTALPLAAQSRAIVRGEAETDAHHEGRLQQWRSITKQMGRSARLALEIQNYLGNTPMVRVIERLYSTSGPTQGRYVTANTDGSISDEVAAWDWDSVSGWTDDTQTYAGSVTRTFWSDFWVVVYPTEWPRGATVTPLTGQEVPAVARDAILRILADWKGADTFCRAIIWSYNATLFDPANPGAAGNPNGTWGNWAKDDGSGNQVVARNIVDARYWIPRNG